MKTIEINKSTLGYIAMGNAIIISLLGLFIAMFDVSYMSAITLIIIIANIMIIWNEGYNKRLHTTEEMYNVPTYIYVVMVIYYTVSVLILLLLVAHLIIYMQYPKAGWIIANAVSISTVLLFITTILLCCNGKGEKEI